MSNIFIPQLWIRDEGSGVSQNWVTQHVSTELSKISGAYLKTDGTNQMSGSVDMNNNDIVNVKAVSARVNQNIEMNDDIDMNNNEITGLKAISSTTDIEVQNNLDMKNYILKNIQGLRGLNNINPIAISAIDSYGDIDLRGLYEVKNPKFDQSDNALVPRYVVDNNADVLEQLFEKGSTSIIPVTGQTVTASSFHANWTRPDHVFDGNPATQWAIANSDTNPWIQVQFPNAVQLYRIILHPRLGNATLTHKVTSSALYGSNDGINYVKVMESNEHVDKVVTIDFNITRPYSYFKLEVMGNQQFGLSQMEMFEASGGNFARALLNPAFTSGFVPMVFVNPLNNYMSIRPNSGIRLNYSGHFVDANLEIILMQILII